MFMNQPLIGRLVSIIERFLVSRVMIQYGRPHSISREFTTYARYGEEER